VATFAQLLTFGIHVPEVMVLACVGVSVTSLAAASFISMFKVRYKQLYGILLIFNLWILLHSEVTVLF